MGIDTLIGIGSALISAGGVFAVLKSRVDTHHNVLFNERGELQFHTKNDCKDKHISDLEKIDLKLELIGKDITNMQETVSSLLERLVVENGRRAYDPKPKLPGSGF